MLKQQPDFSAGEFLHRSPDFSQVLTKSLREVSFNRSVIGRLDRRLPPPAIRRLRLAAARSFCGAGAPAPASSLEF
jgi:hypothetical protein